MGDNFSEGLRNMKSNINKMYSYTKLCINGAKKLFVEKTSDDLYSSLGATDNAAENEAYEEALDSAISNTNNLNIAIMGKYSSGKSSIIKTYFKKPENSILNPIYISLASFNEIKTPKKGVKRNEYFQSIEKSILQQIFYNVDSNKIPLSSFKRINKHPKWKTLLTSVTVVLLLGSIIVFLNPNAFDFLVEHYNILTSKKGFGVSLSVVTFLFVFFMALINKIAYFTLTSFNISKFKFKDAEIEINGKNESLFNRFVDEILYFFEVTSHSVVVIEDLDRFDEPTVVFTKLREMSLLINSSNQIKRRIVFVYAMKDDFFTDYADRTKFFDFILPVIPYVSAVNSNEILWKKLDKRLGISKSDSTKSCDIDKEFINDISVYISESRIIDNVVNEFSLFKKKLNKTEMSDRGLLSLIIYKNLFPREYNELSSNRGFMFDFIQKKGELSDRLKAAHEESNTELIEKRIKIIEESLNGMKEIKEVFISRLTSHENRIVTSFKLNDNSSIDVLEFLELEDEDIFERITNYTTYSASSIDHSHFVYSTFGGYDTLVNRIKTIGINKSKSLEIIDKKIKKNNSLIKEIDDYKISTFFSKINMNDLTKNLMEFEIFLLRRGYISEDYRNYINIFHSGDITESDFNYILTVKKNSMLSYDYEINNLKNTILRLNISAFSDSNFLNNDIVEEIIIKKVDYPKQFNELANILNKPDDSVEEFTIQFISRIRNKQAVIPILFNTMDVGLMQIIERNRDKTELMYSIIDAFLTFVPIDPMSKLSIILIEYIENSSNVDYLFDNYSDERMEKLKKLNIRLRMADIDNKPYSSYIYDNFLINFCEKQLYGYFRYKEISINEICRKHLTAISKSKELEGLYRHVISNMDLFIDEFYKYTNDIEEDEEVLLEVLREVRDIELINDLISAINIQFSNIKNVLLNNQIRNCILIAGKFKGTWDNLDEIFEIYSDNDNIPDKYADFESLITGFFELNYVELSKTKWQSSDRNLRNMHYILTSRRVSNSSLEQTLDSIPIRLNISSSLFDEIDFKRLEMLILNNKLNLTVDVINKLILNEKYELASKVVMPNINRFIKEIAVYDINKELISACVLNEDATEADKLLLLNSIEISLISNNSIKYFIERVNPRDIHKYNEELIKEYFKFQKSENNILIGIKDLLINNIPINNFIFVSEVGEIAKIGDTRLRYAKITKSKIGLEVAELLAKNDVIIRYKEFKSFIRLVNNQSN
ncbi:hypothetical protein PT047_03620 [Erysipelothrix rhusiopathiae]|nr:hypothetical protein [Erysipelothrix rhusiopathiae]MDE8098021.1 hypothetical protein [Erysipelothrix rhusiopathiae]MDE8107995.1 hypothetical protein [Erysipelothrix rhusiopathiae]MDE8111740.1 hypothetical protein [Erysipelothrix rhusiopathiae]MDE8153340.1 hypothetical protein [Erysipelothrix rhusiopathiae]